MSNIYKMGNVDTLNVKEPDKDRKILFSVPELDKALVLKFLLHPNGESCAKVTNYTHLVPGKKPGEFMTRTHPNQTFVNGGEDIEKSARINLYVKRKKLVEAGKKDSDEYKVIEKLLKRSEEKEKSWFYFVEPGSDVIKAICLGPQVTNRLFGKKFQTGKTVPSLVEEMKRKNSGPFDINGENKEAGWVRLYKKGEGLGTEYIIEPVGTEEVKTVDGEQINYFKYTKLSFGSKIASFDFDDKDYPNFREVELKNSFTLQETQAFINSDYSEVPERFLQKRSDGSPQVESRNVPDAESAEAAEGADLLSSIDF